MSIAAWAIVLIALALRLIVAWFTTFHADEFYTLLAARMVFQKGVPILPSGTLWPMGGVLLYLQAPVVGLFGYVEGIARTPGAICSALCALLVYRWGRNLFGGCVALLAALVMAFDPHAVQWGAYARPYSVLPLLVLLSLVSVRRAALAEGTGQTGIAAAIAVVVTIWTHPVLMLWLPAFGAAYWIWCGRLHVHRILCAGVICAVGTGAVLASMYWGDRGLFEAASACGGLFSRSLPMALLRGLGYFKQYPHRLILSVVLFFCGLAWVWALVRRSLPDNQRKRDITALGVFLALAYFGLAVPLAPGQHTVMALLPAFALLGGVALTTVVEILTRPLRKDAARPDTATEDGGDGPEHEPLLQRLLQPAPLACLVIAVAIPAGTARAYWHVFHDQGLGLTQGFRYVGAHWRRGDVLLNAGPASLIFTGPEAKLYLYVEKNAGFGVKRVDGRYVERTIGAPVIDSTEGLKQILDENPRVWYVVLVSKYHLRVGERSREVIKTRMKPVFTSGDTVVYFSGAE